MLVVRNEKFVCVNDNLYLLGSSSNTLYKNNLYQMGDVTILGWRIEPDGYDVTKMTPLMKDPNLKVLLLPDKIGFIDKVKEIKKIVKNAECLSLKFCFVDSLIACHYALKYKKRFVIESGTDSFHSTWYHGGSIKYKLMAVPYELITKYFHRKAKYIIYVSKFFLQKKYPSNACQIGCSDAVINTTDESVLFNRLRRIDESNRRIVLGLIGAAHVEYRGHDTLINVMSMLRNRGYDLEVRFLGGEKNKEKRMAFAQKKGVEQFVFFDGYKDKEGVLAWIDDIDILVMPTLQETLGRAVIEAMSRGCPVVGSRETALSEQLGSDCIAPARDATTISDIIKKMIDNKYYMKACAQENFYRAKKYESIITNEDRKSFYDNFYINEKM